MTLLPILFATLALAADTTDGPVPSLAEARALAPRGVNGVVLVQTFTLEAPFTYGWRAERPAVDEGTILVVEVDPVMSVPRAVGAPVLYVGDTPAARMSWGASDTRMLLLVPGRPDLSETRVYFGSDTLPERVDVQRGAAELAAAVGAGVRPFSASEVAAATVAPVRFVDASALQRHLADLLVEHCPGDAERAEGWRLSGPR